ncbi:MAG: WhiB family transcriptional regulator [Egibacteraceae bacterium]
MSGSSRAPGPARQGGISGRRLQPVSRWFLPGNGLDQTERTKAVCARCSVRDQCAVYARLAQDTGVGGDTDRLSDGGDAGGQARE